MADPGICCCGNYGGGKHTKSARCPEPFTLTPSPADPQAVKVFRLDDYEWWAGYSLEGCIAAARHDAGADCYQNAEQDGEELSDAEMELNHFSDPESDAGKDGRTFAAELALRIAAGEQFPQLFACTEY